MTRQAKFELTSENINDFQVQSIRRLIARCKHAHYTNVYLRINGRDEMFEADWLKHIREVSANEDRE